MKLYNIKKYIFMFPLLLAVFSCAVATSIQRGSPSNALNLILNDFGLLIREYLILSFIVSYLFGKFLEYVSNEYFKFGWRVIDFNVEVFNFISYTHSSVIFAGNLDIFTKNKKRKKFIKALKRRRKLESAEKLVIIYQCGEDSEANLTQLNILLKDNELSNMSKFIPHCDDFPQIAFYGKRNYKTVIPKFKLIFPRYFRYNKKTYFSGIHTAEPFITKTDKDHFELLKKYSEVIFERSSSEYQIQIYS